MAFILGAAPHSALAAAKLTRHAMNTHLLSKMAYDLPIGRIPAAEPSVNPTPSQPSCPVFWYVSATAPWMSAAMVLSRPKSRFAEKMDRQTRNQRKPFTDRSCGSDFSCREALRGVTWFDASGGLDSTFCVDSEFDSSVFCSVAMLLLLLLLIVVARLALLFFVR